MLSIQNYEALTDSSENAIILCNDKEVLKLQTYKQVLSLADVITKVLTDYITERNTCLGLFMNHNVYIPSIIVSLLKLKHAFVFLTVKDLHKSLLELKLNWILSLNDVTRIDSFKETYRLKVDCKNSLILWCRDSVMFQDVSYSNIFCVVQTSGSTGERKIIRVPYGCIEANIVALRKLFGINSKDVIFWGTPLTFDPSLIELLLALQTGASLLIVPYNVSINPYSLYEALFNVKKITVLQIVPSVFLRWRENQIKSILNSLELRVLAFGGENFPKCILKYDKASSLRVFNLYGISEVSCWATVNEIKDETCSDDVSVGQSLEETVIELRDEEGKVVDCGEGEIFIGSRSRVCFINNEEVNFEDCYLKPIFRETGDIGKINEKGVFLIGRKNKIIKRFGHRINLAKMESDIFKSTNLVNRCIWSTESNKILAFILIKNLDVTLKKKTMDKLRVKLISILPEETFPDFIEILENFPLTSHGKINEKALEIYYNTLKPKNDLNCDETFGNLWCKYFGINIQELDEIRNYTFFEMGGSSITALQFIREFEEVSNSECPEGIYKKIFTESLKDCMNCLRVLKPIKRSKKIVNNQAIKKFKESGLEILWSYDLRACVDGSPLVFEKEGSTYIAIGSFSNIFAVLNEKGESVYKVVLPEAIESAPTVSPCGNYLFVGCFNGTMYCIDFTKNHVTWEYITAGKIKSSACYCNGHVIFGSYDKKIHCISSDTGLPLWTTLLDGSIASNPIYNDTLRKIYTATTTGTCFCLCEASGDILWKYKCSGPVFGAPCFLTSKEGIIYPAVQGVLHCLSLEGEKLWTFQADGCIFSSLLFYNDCVVFGCHDKNIYIAKASVLRCDVVRKITLESEISSTPCVSNINGQDVIVAACNSGVIYVLDFRTCSVFWRLSLLGEVFSSPFVHGNRIYVGCRDNKLYCVKVGDSK